MQLKNSNSALSTGRYLRLVAMSVVQIVWQTVLTAIAMYDNISPGLRPWTSWADVHSDFGRIGAIPMVVYPVSYQRQFFLFLWVMPVSSFIFFFFFGFGEEALKDYKSLVRWIRIKVFRQTLPDPSTPLESSFARFVHSIPALVDEQSLTWFCYRSPKSPLSPVKLSSTVDLSDDHTLPAYSPAVDPSFSSFCKDKIGQKIAFQYDIASPVSDTITSRSQYSSSCFSAESSPYIYISDEYPPPSPPAPVVSLPVPTYHRPFSPPTFYPVSSPLARESDLRVKVETRVEVEHIV